jgi:hypothetical protein
MFVHQDPAIAPAVTLPTYVAPRATKPREPAPKQLSPKEIKKAQLLALNKELGEARVSAYRARMKKEIEEIRYRQWRDLQPEWENIVQSTPEKSKTSASQSGAALKGPLAGAAAVAAGTAGLRFQLNEIQDQLNGEDTSGGEDSGIGDFFSGLF